MNILTKDCCKSCKAENPCRCNDDPPEPPDEPHPCPPGTGRCCPGPPSNAPIGKVLTYVWAPQLLYLQGKAEAVAASDVHPGSNGTFYYQKAREYTFHGTKRHGQVYPQCCNEDNFPTSHEERFWERPPCSYLGYLVYERIELVDYLNPENSTNDWQFGHFTTYHDNVCSCVTMVVCTPLANGSFPVSLLSTLPSSKIGNGKKFYANRNEYIVVG